MTKISARSTDTPGYSEMGEERRSDVDRLQTANQRLVKFYQQYDPSAIPVEIKAGAKLRTLAALVQEVEAHIRNHLEKLRMDLKERT
jgi:hypothetical protein